MGIAITLHDYLDSKGIKYDVIEHTYSRCSRESAHAAHIPGDKLAKCVVFEDWQGYLMAIIPSTHKVDIKELDEQLNRQLELATEDELVDLFHDCEVGAVPPVGKLYGCDVVLDEHLTSYKDVYFEAGDHTDLIHITGDDFRTLLQEARLGSFSHHM
jgi:Ala-tRNA(Pro) deacylase